MKGGLTPIHIQRWAPADYLADEQVQYLLASRNFLALAFYRHFIDVSFVSGGDLPAEPSRLAACLHMRPSDVRRGLVACLGTLIEERDGRLYQRRVAAEIAQELAFRESQTEHGKKGGRPTKKPYPKASVSETESPPAPNASALRQRQAPTPAPDEFSTFWAAYPRKVNKGDARKAWKQTTEERPALPALLATLETLRATPQWTEGGGRFIPYPASWLRAGGWEDDPAGLGANGAGNGNGRPLLNRGPAAVEFLGVLKGRRNIDDDKERWKTAEEWAAECPGLPFPERLQ